MNREQAGHLLDAYERLTRSYDDAAALSLREVILDAMTETRYYPYTTWPKYPLVTYTGDKTWGPNITWSNTTAGSVNEGGAK